MTIISEKVVEILTTVKIVLLIIVEVIAELMIIMISTDWCVSETKFSLNILYLSLRLFVFSNLLSNI